MAGQDLVFCLRLLKNVLQLGEKCTFRQKKSLAAQCEIPPHIAQYPVEIVSQRGVSHPFALFSKGIAPVSLRYPLWGGGGIAPLLRMLSTAETLRKGGGGIAPNWPC